MSLLHVYQRVFVHVLLNTRAFSCHFGLLLRTAHSGSEDERTALQPQAWDIDVMISTRASVKARASRRSPLTSSCTGHVPTSDPAGFFTRWILSLDGLSGKAPNPAWRSALMLPLPLRPDKLSIDPAEHLEEHSRYASPSTLRTGWKCSLLLLELSSDKN